MDIVLIVLAIVGGLVSIWQIYEWVKRWRDNRIDNFASIERHAIRLLEKIKSSGYRAEVVVGIGRGGGLIGGWLAGNLGSIRFEVVDRVHNDSGSVDPVDFPSAALKMAYLRQALGDTATALIVEAATTRGATLREFERLRQQYLPGWTCKYAVLFTNRMVDFPVAFSAKTLKQSPEHHAWHYAPEYRHHVGQPRDDDE